MLFWRANYTCGSLLSRKIAMCGAVSSGIYIFQLRGFGILIDLFLQMYLYWYDLEQENKKTKMKLLSLLMWVTQFGLSVLFPSCFFLFLAVWLQRRFALGGWIVVFLGILGLLTSISTARSCIRSLLKDVEAASNPEKPPVSFNDHD